ncbi:hypothetical protein EDB82DRAFT_514725 [Fusarium venenatum]|uniref:uncharacterized protein n=1 Tax=Fusarium venenatum TaxID=56646 RepID=UPI001D2964D3|nr:hypothetical protein EDB82DRAFT_514725 [Fusarium venenatum]
MPVHKAKQTKIQYAISCHRWEAAEILLKLWENLLPHQGLPRTVGYRLRGEYSESEQRPDSLCIILERVTSYIPDWNEIHRSDIHLEAMGPERT